MSRHFSVLTCILFVLPAATAAAWQTLRSTPESETVRGLAEAHLLADTDCWLGEWQDLTFSACFSFDPQLPAVPASFLIEPRSLEAAVENPWLVAWSDWLREENLDESPWELVDTRPVAQLAGTKASRPRGVLLELPGADLNLVPLPGRRFPGLVVGLRYVEFQVLSGEAKDGQRDRLLPVLPSTLDVIAAPRLPGINFGTTGAFGQGVDLGFERRF